MILSKLKSLKQFVFRRKKALALGGLGLLVLLSLSGPLLAQTLTQGYFSDQSLQRGMIVTLKEGDETKVEVATLETASRMFGVVVNASDSPVTLSQEGQQVFVAVIGRNETLVSNQNGPIKPGDYITVSVLNGIGMKADRTHQYIIGQAAGSFDGSQDTVGQTEIKDAAGNSLDVALGRIPVELRIIQNPLYVQAGSTVPNFLIQLTETVAGKSVSSMRIYISLIVFLVSAAISASLLFAGVKSSIVAIGRNPLSRKSVMRGLAQVTLTSLVVFVSGLGAVYLILKL